MTTDYYSKAVKFKSKRNNYRTRHSTRQRTIKDYTNNTRKSRQRTQHRRATTSHRKAIPKEHEWDYQEEPIEEVTMAMGKLC
jgi:hypothetical protein